jgi:CRP-like cAMP-binding protein
MTDDPRAASSSRLSSRELVHELSQHLDFSQWASVTLPGGRTVIRAGDVLERLPLLESGVLDAVIHRTSADGNPVIPVIWGAGELVLLSYLFRRDPVTVDVVVSQEARLRWIPVQVIEDTLTRHHELLIQLVRFLSRRLGQVQSREQTWLESGVHERVCASLARIIGGLVLPAAGPCVIATTHESLAARCGVSRPRLSRELKQLEDAGQLRLRRGTIEIVDPGWFERHWP